MPDYQQRYQYKNAINGYLYNDYTPAHREAELSWMGSIYATSLAAAAMDRKLAPEALRATLEAGPYSADEAKANQAKADMAAGSLREAMMICRTAAGVGETDREAGLVTGARGVA